MRPIPEITEPFGLVAWLEMTRVTLPLKGVECRFAVTAGVASVEIDQVYHQSYSSPLDCTYTFPLPDGAAVYRCELHVNGHVIRAVVREKGEAKRLFAAQKAAGRRAALVESVRPNLFTLSLGNIQPEDVVVVRLAYFQTLERGAGELRLRIPVCPGERYIPGKPLLRSNRGRGVNDDTDEVPDASLISPPRIDALHPDAAYFSVEGTLAGSDVANGSLSSPTHPVVASVQGNAWRVRLAVADSVPDRDIVVRWTEPAARALESRAWKSGLDGSTFALVQLRAPADAPVAEGFEQDVYFLVDRSGSMAGAKWTKTCEALDAFVGLLGTNDRVWITLFESSYQDFAEAPLSPGELRTDPTFRSLEKLGVTGGTELIPAAKHVIERITMHSRERRAVIVLITDGQVGNEDPVLSMFRDRRDVAVFVFGIDTAVNDALLKRLAVQQGGACRLQTPNDDIRGAVAGLAARLRRPVITDLQVTGTWLAAPERLPDLFAGETVDLCLRTTGAVNAIDLEGRLPDGSTRRFALTLEASDNGALPLLWAREHIAELELRHDREQAVKTGQLFNLLCASTAFIAWDEAGKVKIAEEEIYQPSMAVSFASSALRCFAAQAPPDDGALYDCMDAAPILGDWLGVDDAGAAFAPLSAPPKGGMLSRVFRTERRTSAPMETHLIKIGIDPKVAGILVAWSGLDQTLRRARPRLLKALIATLLAYPASPNDLLTLCSNFIETHLTHSPEYDQAKEALAAWAARLPSPLIRLPHSQ
jgi:Ca-activated chloride channel family protein